MAWSPQPNSYGTLAGVASYVRMYTVAGSFSASTVPTDAAVGAWLDQISAIVNGYLAGYGFVIPITQADVKLAIVAVVEQLAADLCQAANSAGRFFSDKALQAGASPWAQVRKDIKAFCEASASGFEVMGAPRTQATEETAWGFKDTDQAGNPTAPIFQRSGFGNQFEDWDTGAGHSNVNWPPTGPGEQ
jgi:hypothetical protein